MANVLFLVLRKIQRFLFVITLCLPCLSYAEDISYQYDEMDRLLLTSHPGSVKIDYSYDALANPLSFTASTDSQNVSPSMPTDEIPQSGTSGVLPAAVTLSWASSETDNNDLLFYDLYLGLDSTPQLYKSGLEAGNFTVTRLLSSKTYYWKIVARDNHNAVVEGPMWSFSTGNTPPATAPVQVSPTDNLYASYENLIFKWGGSFRSGS